MTTIVSVRRNGKVVIGGDGQATMGNTVMKGNVRKVRRLYNDRVIAGFAGGTADAFTSFSLSGKFHIAELIPNSSTGELTALGIDGVAGTANGEAGGSPGITVICPFSSRAVSGA